MIKLDVDQLRQLAVSGGGRYVDLARLGSLIRDLQASSEQAGSAREQKNIRVAHWLDGGVWLLPLLLLVAAALGRRGWL